jgi:hypothetical protein
VHLATVPLVSGRSVVQQFRYLFVTDAEGLKTIDVTDPENPVFVPGSKISLAEANKVFVARTYAYVAAGTDGLVIVDIEDPENIAIKTRFNEGVVDAKDVVVATTNASLFAYIADGVGGLKVIQLTSPDSQPRFYGFSPEPKPELIAVFPMKGRALGLSRGLERDRAVDETGGQVALFNRIGSGPLSESDMRALYLNKKGEPWFVEDDPAQKITAENKTSEIE